MKLVINAIPIRPGGGLTVLIGLLDGLRKTNAPLEIVVLASDAATIEELHRVGHADEVRPLLENVGAARAFLWQNLQLGRLLNELEADLLLTVNHYLLNISCPQVVYHLNLTRFLTDRPPQSLTQRINEAIRDKTARWAVERADMNVYESHFLKEAALNLVQPHSDKQRVIYIGLPDETVNAAVELPEQEYQPAVSGTVNLLSITSPHVHKDNDTLIKMMRVLCDERPHVDWQLHIAGGTNAAAWQTIQQLAAELGVVERITWHGFCQWEQLEKMLHNSLCLVSTSLVESFAMVAVEAMARRCPAIVVDATSMPESVGKAGILVPPKSSTEFAKAVLRLHDDAAWRTERVQQGIEHIQSLRWSDCGYQFVEVFEQCTGKRLQVAERKAA